MSADRPKRETMSLEEATVSNMWEIAAIVDGRRSWDPLHRFLCESSVSR